MGASKSPRRRKYACSEWTMRSATVAEAAVSAWPSTWPPKTWGLPISRLSPRKRFTSRGSSSRSCSRSASCGFIVYLAQSRLRRVARPADRLRSSRGPGSGPGPLYCLLLHSIRDTEPLVHDGARGGVLQELAFLREEVVLDGEGGERRFVKARQDELLLAGIGVDVAHREDSRQGRLELLGVHLEGLLLELEPPLGDRPELRMQTEEDEKVIRLERVHGAVRSLDADPAQLPVRGDQRMRQRLEAAQAAGRSKLPHFGHGGGSGAKFCPPVHQRQAPPLSRQLQRPVEGGIPTAEYDEAPALERADILYTVEDALALERLGALDADGTRLERADPCGDHHRTRIEAGAGGSGYGESAILPAREMDDLLPKVKPRVERLDLLHQPVDQLLGPTDRDCRNVVDGLVRVELRALPAGMRQGVDHMGTDAEQSQLEHLEEAAGTRSDDDHFC